VVNKSECFEQALQYVRNHRHLALERADTLRHELLTKYPTLNQIEQQMISLIKKQMLATIASDTSAEELENKLNELHQQRSYVLTELGYPPHVFSPVFHCSSCQDTGMIDGKYCECVKRIAYQNMLSQLARDLPIDDFSFDSFSLAYYDDPCEKQQMNEVFTYCQNYAKTFSLSSESLYLMGSTGLGKTHLTFSIAKDIVTQGYSVIYCTAQNMITELEKEYFKHEIYNGGEHYRTCQLLIIDDLGTEFLSPIGQSVLYNIVNTRILKHLPTIINSNLSPTQIEERYGQRLTSRIFGCYKTLKFVGKDIRIQKRLISKKV